MEDNKVKSYIKMLGLSLVIFLVGISGMIFSSLFLGGIKLKMLQEFIISLALLLGGILVVYVVNKKSGSRFKDFSTKVKIDITIIVILLAVFESYLSLFLFFGDRIGEKPDKLGFISLVLQVIDSIIIFPIAEELIFRYGMLTLLFKIDDSKLKVIISVIFTSFLWTLMHCPNDWSRVGQLMISGSILGYIYYKCKNILYCIIYHVVTNVSLYYAAYRMRIILGKKYLLYIYLIGFLVLFISFAIKNNNRRLKQNG